MKKLMVLFLVLFSLSVIAQQGIHEPGTGIESPEIKEAGQGTGQGLAGEMVIAPLKEQIRARNMTHLEEMVQERERVMEQEMEGFEEKVQKVYQNQNQVRLAVHNLLAMEELVGGIGPQIREVARNFNNSVRATLNAEERIEKRGGFARFFAGGDAEAAEEIEGEVAMNRERIQELQQLHQECQADGEVCLMLQEQIQKMEQEQNRLQELAGKEKKSKGLFGWLWK